MCARILWWFGGAPSSGFSRHMNLNRSWMMLVGWANKMMILFIAKERGKLQPFCHWWCYFIFSVFGHKVYQACFVTHPKLMTPPPTWLTSKSHPSLLSIHATDSCHSQKSQKLCGNPNIWLGSWGTYGVGEEWPRIPCPSSTFSNLFFILETIINPYKLILPSIESPEGGQ
jgi:hypothetical protein